MALKKTKRCQMCRASFTARRDAKTCSPTCRKRLQRTLRNSEANLSRKIKRVESGVSERLHRLAGSLISRHIIFEPIPISDERGSIQALPIKINTGVDEGAKVEVRQPGQVYQPNGQELNQPAEQFKTEQTSSSQTPSNFAESTLPVVEQGTVGAYGARENPSIRPIDTTIPSQDENEEYPLTHTRSIWTETISKFRHRWVVFAAVICLVLLPLAGGFLLLNSKGGGGNQGGEGSGGNGPLTLSQGGLSSSNINRGDKFSVNLTLEAKNTLIISPTEKPQNLEKGQIYLDQNTDKLLFFDGSKLHDLGASSTVVNNIQGPTNITNSTIINSIIQTGVTKISGTADQINVSSSTGNVTLSLPQDIGTGSTPTFSGLNLGSALQIAYGGTGATSFAANSLLLGNGSGTLQTTNVGSTGDCLIVNGSGVPTFQSCAGGGGVFAGGSQTAGYLTKFDTTTNQIVNSLVNESGSTVTVNGDLAITGTASGDGSGLTSLDAGNISSGTLANARLVNSGALTVTAGTGLSGGGSVTLGGTTTLNVAYGSSADTAVEGDTTLNCASGTGNLSGGGDIITLGNGGSCSDISITNSPTFTGTVTGNILNATSEIQLNGVDINTGGTLSNVAYLDQDQTLRGHNIFQNASNSTSAFQIQDLAGTSNLFIADTINNRIGIGTLGPGYRLDVQGGDINTSGIYRVNGAQISSANLSNDSNLAKINGANIFTNTNTFSGSVSIQGANSLTLGTASNAGSIIFRDGSTAFTGTLQLSGSLSGNVDFGLPVTTGIQTICTVESGNCAGSGSGITGSGTTNKLAKFTAGQTVGDSSISDDGTTVTVGASQIIQGASGLTIGNSGVDGVLSFKNGSNSNVLTLQSGATTSDLTFTLPTGDGSNGDCLQTNGAGVLAFSACTGGAGGGVTSINTLTGVLNVVGTANQISVSSAGDTITLSLPQDINTGGNANFRTITLTGQAATDNLIVANAVSGATGNLLDLQVNGSSKFTVGASGNVNATGQYQVNGLQISSADLSNDSDLAKLSGTGPQIFIGDNEFTGTFLSRNATDSTAAFQIQNAAGTSNLLVADTADSRIGIGAALPGYTLDVNGDINTNGVYRINGVTVCSSSGCAPSSGSGDYIQNGTSLQANANFNIQTAAAASVGGVIQGAVSQTADLFQLKDSAGTILTAFDKDGRLVFGPSGSQDTILYRSVASTLKTDGNLVVSGLQPTGSGNTAADTVLNVTGGKGQDRTTTGAAGTGGALSLAGGAGGDNSSGASGGNGGSGGAINLTGGAGGHPTTGLFGNGGTGGNITIQGGSGGSSLNTFDGGNGGSVSIQGGNGGSGSDANGLYGAVTIQTTGGNTTIGNTALNYSTTLQAGTGGVLVKPANSTTAFQIQNAAGNSNLFVADTTNTRIGIGVAPTLATLQVNGTGFLQSGGTTDTLQAKNIGTGNIFKATNGSGDVLIITNSGNLQFTQTSPTISIGNTGSLAFNDGTNTLCTITDAGSTGNLSCSGNITGASTGTVGYWSRSGTTVQPATAGDAVTTSGNISTTGSGTITSAGLLTGSAGLTVTGGAVNLNASSNNAVNIGTGTSTGTVSIGNSGAGAITLQSGSTINLTAGAASTFTTSGASGYTFRPGADTTTVAFRVQNAAGTTDFFRVDTFAGKVNLLNAYVNNSATGLTALSVNQTAAANIADFTDSSTSVFTIADEGAATFKNKTNSTTAFQIQNASGNTLLNFDTSVSSGRLVIGGTGSSSDKIELYRSSTTPNNFIHFTTASPGTDWTIGQATGTNDFSFWNDNLTANVAVFTAGGNIQLGPGVTNGTLTADIAGSTTGNAVCHSGGASAVNDVQIVDCSGTISDYAEDYPVAPGTDYGDIVAMGTSMVNTYDTDHNSGSIDWTKVKGQVTQLVKADTPYQGNTIGIVSDNYSDFSSTGHNIKDEDNPMPVALKGRLPVKVTPASDPIQPGDYVTTSTDPGKAMKATQAGFVIGKALEAWNPASGKTQVMVYVEQGYWPGPAPASSLQDGGDVSLNTLVASIANINQLTADNASITSLIVNSATVDTLHITGEARFDGNLVSFSDNVRGINLPLESGDNLVDVTFGSAYPDTDYAVQCTPSYNTTCYITDKTVDGFKINFGNAPADDNQKVDWFVVR